jgi:hypothetical protein
MARILAQQRHLTCPILSDHTSLCIFLKLNKPLYNSILIHDYCFSYTTLKSYWWIFFIFNFFSSNFAIALIISILLDIYYQQGKPFEVPPMVETSLFLWGFMCSFTKTCISYGIEIISLVWLHCIERIMALIVFNKIVFIYLV